MVAFAVRQVGGQACGGRRDYIFEWIRSYRGGGGLYEGVAQRIRWVLRPQPRCCCTTHSTTSAAGIKYSSGNAAGHIIPLDDGTICCV